MTRNAAGGILAAIVAGAVLLIVVEVVHGRSVHQVPIANPCLPRTLPDVRGLDGAVQQVVLGGLDRAACRLGTSRENVVLSIAGTSAGGTIRWSRAEVATAVREGLRGALQEAGRRGTVPAFAVPFLDRLIREAPIEQLVRGGFSLSNLFGG